jgi:hypothetical protein
MNAPGLPSPEISDKIGKLSGVRIARFAATHRDVGKVAPISARHMRAQHYVLEGNGGAEGDRTPDLYTASVALSQLSYGPDHLMAMDGPIAARRRLYVRPRPAASPISIGW